MNRKQAALLLEVAKTVEAHEDRFDFTVWVGPDYNGRPDLSCGTTACALGWATTIPSLRKLGLRLRRNDNIPWPALVQKRKVVSTDSRDIGRKLFGITPRESDYLFIPNMGMDRFISGKNWATACRNFVLNKLVYGSGQVDF